MSGLIYFCTVITTAFKPFNENVSYNYLNGTYPGVFTDANVYRKFCMINYFSIHAKHYFDLIPARNQYLPTEQPVVIYAIHSLLNTIVEQLKK